MPLCPDFLEVLRTSEGGFVITLKKKKKKYRPSREERQGDLSEA